MKNLSRNFISFLKAYKTAAILNIIGLAAAFTAFILIMIQVKYDLTFDKFHAKGDRIYRIGSIWENGWVINHTSRDRGEYILAHTSGIETGGLIDTEMEETTIPKANGQKEYIDFLWGKLSLGIFDVFDFVPVAGDLQQIATPGKVIIPESLAKNQFNGSDAIGKQIIIEPRFEDPETYEVAGVYKDFPKNSSIKNSIYRDVGTERLNNSNNWHDTYYIVAEPGVTQEQLLENINESIEKRGIKTTDTRTLIAFQDIYFNPTVKDQIKGNKTTTYALFSVAVIILLIALINFINFAMAMVPARIRNINTQKVLGASNGSIRRNILFEAVGLTLLSYGIALLAVYWLSSSTLAGVIDADLSFYVNNKLLWSMAGVALLAGVFAGIYPAFYITSFQPALVLKGSFGSSQKGRVLRRALIVFQYSVSIILMIVAFGIIRQNHYMANHSMGIDGEYILTFNIPGEFRNKKEVLNDLLREEASITDVT